jgi:hypothetical protein
MHKTLLGLALLAAAAVPAHADIRITEVAPYASGNTAYGADWFELTNTGTTAVDITGWRVDDSSAAFGASLALRGITSIGAGQSVVFIESNASGTNDATRLSGFVNAWFNGAAPASFAMGFYGGSGIGLSTGGDAVNIYNAAGALQAGVSFGTSDDSAPFQSFDNAAGQNGVAISQLSALGANGARVSFDGIEIGSPGAVAAVPEPETYAMLLAGIGVIATFVRRRKAA